MGINNSISHTTQCVGQTQEEVHAINSMQQIVDQEQWQIDFRVYVDSKWKKVIPLIRKSKVQFLKVENTKIPDFIPRIVHIEFSSLKSIKLSNNYIASLEAIAYLKAPLLQHLEINSNHIISLRSLRKLNAPNLNRIILVENIINDASWLIELDCDSNFKQILMFASRRKVLPESYNWIFKMKPTHIHLFQFYNTKIIRNSKIRDMLRQRYSGINVLLRYDAVQ